VLQVEEFEVVITKNGRYMSDVLLLQFFYVVACQWV